MNSLVVVRVQGGAHALIHDDRLANDTNRIGRAGKRGRSVEVGKRLWLVQTYHLMIHVQSGGGRHEVEGEVWTPRQPSIEGRCRRIGMPKRR